MKKLTLITALLLATSPVAAQSGQQALGAGGQTNNSPLPDTGIVCQQEMTATFCNAPTSPNIGGFGSSRGSTSSAGSGTGSGSGTSAGAGSNTFAELTGGPSHQGLDEPPFGARSVSGFDTSRERPLAPAVGNQRRPARRRAV